MHQKSKTNTLEVLRPSESASESGSPTRSSCGGRKLNLKSATVAGVSYRRRHGVAAANEFLLCPYCGCRYKGKSSYTTHLRKKHPDMQKEIICYVCNSNIDERQFERHFRIHRDFELRESQQSSHQLLRCDFCEFSCSLDVDMIQHTGVDHDGNKIFSMARTQSQFLTKTRNSKRKVSENDSEKTLSGNEAPEAEYEEVLEETVVNMDGAIVVESDPRSEILVCLKRGQAELLENGYAEVMLHHLLISPYERSWIKLLVAVSAKYIRLPIEMSSLAGEHCQLTNFVIENEVPCSLKKLFVPGAWSHLESMIRMKRAQYYCAVCQVVQYTRMIQCSSCKRRYHQICSLKGRSAPANSHDCSSCYL